MISYLLSWLIWLPIVSGIALLCVIPLAICPYRLKVLAIASASLTFLLSLFLFFDYNNTTANMQFVENVLWIERFNIHYHLGIDGFSLLLILLNTVTTPLVLLASWRSIQNQVAVYLSLFLIMSGLTTGVFCALDMALFYVFWEATLIPLFITIGIWGGQKRVYAAIKFFLYTLAGSLLMLIALLYLYQQTDSFAIADFHRLPLPLDVQTLIFFAFFVAFAVKIPMTPVHTWLPDAHVQAPTGGSIILAAIMLKLGGYGFLRLALPITPDASVAYADWMIVLSLIAIIYIGLVALVQKDMKKLIAYSSIAHMGLVTLGLFLFDHLAIAGSVIQMISHGFISGALFFCVGVIYDRMKSREISDYGGVAKPMPVYAAFLLLFAMANSGLPGTSGFVGEFLVIVAAVGSNLWIGLLAATTLVTGAAYTLWMYKRVIFGEVVSEKVNALKDVDNREWFIVICFAIMIVVMGIWPMPFIDVLDASLDHLLLQVTTGKLK